MRSLRSVFSAARVGPPFSLRELARRLRVEPPITALRTLAKVALPPSSEGRLELTEMKPGERKAVTFIPPEGRIEVHVEAVQVDLAPPTGKPSADPDQPDIGVTQRQNVDVEASLFAPGDSSVTKSKTFAFRDVFNDPPRAPLELGVRPEQVGRQWSCRFQNTGKTAAKISGLVRVVRKSEPEPPLPSEVSVNSRASLPVTLLRPNDSTPLLPFKPAAGEIEVSVAAIEVGIAPPTGRPTADPDKPEIGVRQPQNVTVDVELRASGRVVAAATFHSNDALNEPGGTILRHVVTATQAGETWGCRVRNRSAKAIRCSATVSFLAEGLQTELPLEVLNNGLRQLISAIGLTVRLDGRQARIRVSPELQAFADGQLEQSLPLTIDLPLEVNDFNLQTFGAVTRSINGRAVISTHARFETTGQEVDTFVGVIPVAADVSRLAATVTLTLFAVGSPGRRGLVAIPTVKVDAQVFTDLLGFFGVNISGEVRDTIVDRITAFVESDAFRDAVRRYLTDGLIQLVRQGHEFVDLRADADALIVVHRDPKPDEPPLPPQPPHVLFPRPQSVQPAPAGDAAANLAKIKRLVVLMLENRSFDHLLGYLSHPAHGLERLRRAGREVPDGLTGDELNPFHPGSPSVRIAPYPIGNVNLFDGRHVVPATAVPFSPNHDIVPVVAQIGPKGEMQGFAVDFATRFPNVDPQLSMSFYTDSHLPVYDALAERYAVCDRWFCSHPGATFPNRFCTLSGHIPDLENFRLDNPILGYLRMPTIFDVLTDAGVDWAYFEGDIGFLRMYDRYRLDSRHVLPFKDFVRRAALGLLPPVTFIDPNFADVPPSTTANDDHAPADLRLGQRLVAAIHDILVASPDWITGDGGTLLVVTYDEHGGFFDHVAPPGTESSDHPNPVPPIHPKGKTFYGPRVPTFAIGPFIRPGSVDHTVYDHTSIIATILRRFVGKFPAELGPRPALANHLGHVLTLDEPRQPSAIGPMTMPRDIRGFRDVRPDPDAFHAAMRALARPRRRA